MGFFDNVFKKHDDNKIEQVNNMLMANVNEKKEDDVETMLVRCVKCRAKKGFAEPPTYQEYNLKDGRVTARLSGFCDQGHKISLFVKRR